jgi:long-chain acyl-CoA synthetase
VHDGSNISPQEVEDALLEHPAVENAGVVGVHDLMHGESVRAYVEFKPGASRPTAAELIQFARARVGYKAPEDIVVLEIMPLNATGKVDRAKLKALAAGDHAHHVWLLTYSTIIVCSVSSRSASLAGLSQRMR